MLMIISGKEFIFFINTTSAQQPFTPPGKQWLSWDAR
jgi:hypothetical protein